MDDVQRDGRHPWDCACSPEIGPCADHVNACGWWAMCENDATTTRPHPVLGDVPICARCNERCERIEQGA
jgi:hypothetical protein